MGVHTLSREGLPNPQALFQAQKLRQRGKNALVPCQRGRVLPMWQQPPSGVRTQSRHLGHPQRQPRPQGREQLQCFLPERNDKYGLLALPLDPYPGQRTDGQSKGQ